MVAWLSLSTLRSTSPLGTIVLLVRDMTSLLVFLVGFSQGPWVIVVVLCNDVPDLFVVSIAFVAGEFNIVVVAIFGGSAEEDVPARCVVVFVACFLFFFFFFGIVFVVVLSGATVATSRFLTERWESDVVVVLGRRYPFSVAAALIFGAPTDDDTRPLSSSAPSSMDIVVVSIDTKRKIEDDDDADAIVLVEGGAVDANEGS